MVLHLQIRGIRRCLRAHLDHTMSYHTCLFIVRQLPDNIGFIFIFI
jgi:hypothetical protein